jgi:hypothetical protein
VTLKVRGKEGKRRKGKGKGEKEEKGLKGMM